MSVGYADNEIESALNPYICSRPIIESGIAIFRDVAPMGGPMGGLGNIDNRLRNPGLVDVIASNSFNILKHVKYPLLDKLVGFRKITGEILRMILNVSGDNNSSNNIINNLNNRYMRYTPYLKTFREERQVVNS